MPRDQGVWPGGHPADPESAARAARDAAALVRGDVVACPGCGRRNRLPAAVAGWPRCGDCRRPLPWVVDAGDDTFAEIAEAATLPVLVDLWAPWCGPCRRANPALDRIAVELAGQVKLVRVRVDQAPRLWQRLALQSVPALLVLRQARVVGRQIGTEPTRPLRTWVAEALAAP